MNEDTKHESISSWCSLIERVYNIPGLVSQYPRYFTKCFTLEKGSYIRSS